MLGKGVQSGKGRLKRPGGIQVGVLDMPGGGGIHVQVFSQSCDVFCAHIHHNNGILNNWNQVLHNLAAWRSPTPPLWALESIGHISPSSTWGLWC